MGILHDTTTPATQYSTMMVKKFWVTKISARLAQSVEHETLNLRVVGSSPTLGEIFLEISACVCLVTQKHVTYNKHTGAVA